MKHEEKTKTTKNNLMLAFLDLYKDKKIEKISVKEITDLAGYNRGTFYVYYKDVYDILEQAETMLMDRLSYAVEQVLNLKVGFSPESFFRIIMNVFIENQELASVLMSRGTVEFHHALKSMAKEKIVRLDDDMDAEEKKTLFIAVEYQISGVIGVISNWMSTNREMSIEEVMAVIVDITKNGVFQIVNRYT